MTEEERQGNDKKEDDALEPYDSPCFAKLFIMKEKDAWEELFVGMCTVNKIVGAVWQHGLLCRNQTNGALCCMELDRKRDTS